jgi:hypothetical protein
MPPPPHTFLSHHQLPLFTLHSLEPPFAFSPSLLVFPPSTHHNHHYMPFYHSSVCVCVMVAVVLAGMCVVCAYTHIPAAQITPSSQSPPPFPALLSTALCYVRRMSAGFPPPLSVCSGVFLDTTEDHLSLRTFSVRAPPPCSFALLLFIHPFAPPLFPSLSFSLVCACPVCVSACLFVLPPLPLSPSPSTNLPLPNDPLPPPP